MQLRNLKRVNKPRFYTCLLCKGEPIDLERNTMGGINIEEVLGTTLDGEHLVLRSPDTGEISVVRVDPSAYLQVEIWLSSQNESE